MGPLEATKTCLRKCRDFKGRAGRAEFWWFGLFYLAGAFAIFWSLDVALSGVGMLPPYAMLAFLLIFLIPFQAAAWRCFHDIGWVGSPALVPFILLAIGITMSVAEFALTQEQYAGILGAIIGYGGFLITGIGVLVPLLWPSQANPNPYGPNPHEVTS